MSNIVIGIHGLGNKPDYKTLKKWWKMSLIEGLERNCNTFKKFDFEMVYWADLLNPEPLDFRIKDAKNPLYIEDPYIASSKKTNPQSEFFTNLRKKLLDYFGDQLDRIFLNDDLTINFSSVSDFVINRFFEDLAIYYNTHHDEFSTTDADMKLEIRERLRGMLWKNRHQNILLIAHSMGSIIAFDVLTEMKNDISIKSFITIGSPLGLPTIRSKISAEHSDRDDPDEILKTPENVDQWHNLADIQDKIAVYYQLKEDYKANKKGVTVKDHVVINDYTYNGEESPHKSYGYLRTPEMSILVNEFLEHEPYSFLSAIKFHFWNKIHRILSSD